MTARVESSRALLFVGALVIGVVALVTYHPALQVGFWFDDYVHLETAGRRTWLEFWTTFLSTRAHFFYRPVQFLQWRFEYAFLGDRPVWYHVIQTLYHVSSTLLLYGLIRRLSGNWLAGFVGALVYAVLPAYSLAVFWLGTPDPLSATFYLLAIWFWMDHLEQKRWFSLGLAFAAFVISLLAKEIALTLPMTLWLIDRWVVAQPARWKEWMLRIAPFLLFLPVWMLGEGSALTEKLAGESTGVDGGQLFSNLLNYASVVTFPWDIDSPIRYLTLAAALGVWLYAVATRKMRLFFLLTVGLVSVVPTINSVGIGQRYLYLPLMVSAAGVGVLVAWLYRLVSRRLPNFRSAVLGAFALVVTLAPMRDSLATAEAAEGFSALARQTRLQFRPIYQRHATFEPDTLLYFVEPPFASYDVSGLMFLRYGANVFAAGTDNDRQAELRRHSNAFVFYRDEQNIFREQRVNSTASVSVHPGLPAHFGEVLSLEGFEVVDTRVKSGDAIIVLLYWRTLKATDRDYTVFAHLLDDHDNILANYDGPPRRGASPTSAWRIGSLNVDAVIVPIGPGVPAGDHYRLEVGLYFQPTMERLPVTNPGNSTEWDRVLFEPFRVVP